MMVMTAKVNLKKIGIALAAAVGVIVLLIALLGGGNTAQTAAPAVSGNDSRVQFLADLGYQVNASPTQSGQVRIPQEESDVYSRYNEMQKQNGYDLSPYAGKTVMRYVYKVTNYPDATEPVYATLLVYKNQIIGGDITDTAPKGKMSGLKKQEASQTEATTSTETTAPTETTLDNSTIQPKA